MRNGVISIIISLRSFKVNLCLAFYRSLCVFTLKVVRRDAEYHKLQT